MIISYCDKRTRVFAEGKRIKAFSGFERAANLKLDRLDDATLWPDGALGPENVEIVDYH